MDFKGLGILCLGMLVFGFDSQAGPDPLAIMQKNEEVRRVQSIQASATLTTGGANTPERVKSFTWWRKLRSDGIRFNTLTRFHLPAEIRGEGILFLENSADQNEVLMYLPAYKKIRRVESQQQSSSFMGSEFSYSDIATPHVEDYNYKYLRQEPCPSTAPGVQCHVIESTPKSDAVRERTGYSRNINWVRQDNSMEAQIEFYGLDDKLRKRLLASEVKIVDQAKGKWMAHRVRVEGQLTQKFTLLEFRDVKVNQDVPDATFTQQRLASER